jgi:hypothetical protein
MKKYLAKQRICLKDRNEAKYTYVVKTLDMFSDFISRTRYEPNHKDELSLNLPVRKEKELNTADTDN